MSNFIKLFSLLIIYVTFQNVATNPIDEMSYLETINIQHENDKWICGNLQCPKNTYGCNISLKTEESNRKSLFKSLSCFNKKDQDLLSVGFSIELSKEKIIDIELESYDGAVSDYSISYCSGGHENAKGVVAANELNNLKVSARQLKKKVYSLML